MKKNLFLMFVTLLYLFTNAKPPKTVRVVTVKPVHAHYSKPYYGKPYYVKIKPNRSNVVFIKPACPTPNHVWIDGNWVWNDQINDYIWIEGSWVIPQPNLVWVSGHWKSTKYGWQWIPGHWK
jgi:hypothetical protein